MSRVILSSAYRGHQRQRAVDIVSGSAVPESNPQICRHSALFRLLSISRKQSARTCASADKLGDGPGNGLGLLQHQKVSRTRQVDNTDTLAKLLAERVAIARRS